MPKKNLLSQSYSRHLSQCLSTLGKIERRLVPWDVWIGGLLFLVGYTVISTRLGARVVVGTGSINVTGKPCRIAAAETFKTTSRDLFSYAERLLAAVRGSTVDGIQKILDDVTKRASGLDDDFLSWVYQALKKDRSDAAFKRVMEGKGKKKLACHDLLVATQFFTDRYMVDFLVRESLARADVKNESLEHIAVIDPACGTGNFLLSAFDFLWKEFVVRRKQPPKHVAQLLVRKVLIGFDLDPLLASLCKLNLILKVNGVTGLIMSPANNVFGGNHFQYGFLDLWEHEGNSTVAGWKQLRKVLRGDAKKIFVTNPPFAGKRDLDPTLREFIKEHQPLSRGDLCVAFMERALATLKVGDVAGFVTQRSWMFLSSFYKFREHVLSQYALTECVDLGSKAFKDIGGEKSSVALPIFTKSPIEKHHCTFYRVLDRSTEAKQNTLANKHELKKRLVMVPQSMFFRTEDNALRYFVNGGVSRAFAKSTKYGDFALPMQGTSTGDHRSFIDVVWRRAHDKEWRSVSKGGGYCKWAGLNHYAVRWGKNGELVRANPGSAIRNIERMSNTQLSYSDTGTSGLSVRLLRPGQIFVASGPGIQVTRGSKFAHLAFLNSRMATFLLRQLNPKLTVSAGYLARLPVPETGLEDKMLSSYGKQCVDLKTRVLARRIKNPEFSSPQRPSKSLSARITDELTNDLQDEIERLMCEAQIESLLARMFHFDHADLEVIQNETGRCAFSLEFEGSSWDIEQIDKDIGRRLTAGCEYETRKSGSGTVGCDGVLEELALNYSVSPRALFKLILKNISALRQVNRLYLENILHKEVLYACSFRSVINWIPTRVPLDKIVNSLYKAYPDVDKVIRRLIGPMTLEEWTIEELPAVHADTFLSKPLLYFDKRTLYLSHNY